jgi:NMD protein affecting ribosome stability and mRNA decay
MLFPFHISLTRRTPEAAREHPLLPYVNKSMALILSRFKEMQIYGPKRRDPYRDDAKPKGSPQCMQCKAISIRGRWIKEGEALKKLRDATKFTSKSTSNKSIRKKPVFSEEKSLETSLCPACKQFKENYALGVIEIHGLARAGLTRDEAELISQTVTNTEKIARSRNDQSRVLYARNYRGVTKIYVTLPELARHIGRTLFKTFKGEIQYHSSSNHSKDDRYLRVIWHPRISESDNPSGRHKKPKSSRSKNHRHRSFR